MSRHSSKDYDWNQSDSEPPFNVRNKLMYTQLPSNRHRKYKLWENLVDAIIAIALLILFTSPIWMPAFGITAE